MPAGATRTSRRWRSCWKGEAEGPREAADGAFFIGEVPGGKLPGETFPVVGEGVQQRADIVGPAVEQEIDVFRQPHVSVERDGDAADDDEADPRFSEPDQQFFERGFHRRSEGSTCRPAA
jgi:hypothetical protein